MAHHIGDFDVSSTWAAICNELCYRVAPAVPRPLHPGGDAAADRRASTRRPASPSWRSASSSTASSAINLNPDPSGGHWTAPPLTDRHWYPIYEKMVEYDIPAMIHVSTSCNACFHTTGAHYINADTTAFMQLIQGDLFKDFPTLRFVIPHGGGAVPYHWGRYRGLAQELKKPLLEGSPAEQRLLRHLRLPPAGHRPADQGDPGRQHPVRQRDDRRGARHRSGDRAQLRRHQALHRGVRDLTPAEERHKIYEGNARRVYPRLDAALEGQGSRNAGE